MHCLGLSRNKLSRGMDKEAIIEYFLEDLSRSSEQTRNSRIFYCKKFLQFAGNKPFTEWNKTLVNDFVTSLEDEGYAPLTIRNIIGIVKRVFDAAKAVHEAERTRLISSVNPKDQSAVAEILQALSLPSPQWDMGKRAMPRGVAIDRPVLALDEIKQMVTAARDDSLELPQVFYLSLASIYGLRREELLRVRREDLDFNQKTIFVHTVKGGEQRPQLLADEIIPYLKEYSFDIAYSPFMMSFMFDKICAKSGVEDRDGGGWHCFRRALDTTLRDLCGALPTKMFMRWRLSSSPEMVDRYYSKDPLENDAFVLSKHPVVEFWA